MTITILNGYEIFEKTNQRYKNYLDAFLRINQEHPAEWIIISGGSTD